MDWGLKLVYEGPVDNKAAATKISSQKDAEKEPNRRLIVGLVIIGLFLSAYIISRSGKR